MFAGEIEYIFVARKMGKPYGRLAYRTALLQELNKLRVGDGCWSSLERKRQK